MTISVETKRVVIYLNIDDYEIIQKSCKEMQISVSEGVRRAIYKGWTEIIDNYEKQ